MIIWKPPAFLIMAISLVISLLVGYVCKTVLEWVTTEDSARALLFIIWGITAVAGDLQWRRDNSLELFDLSASTLFFVLPTWLVGSALLIGGVITGF